MPFHGTIVIAQSGGSDFKAEALETAQCAHCGGRPADLGAYYRELGEEAVRALYDGTPCSFWQAIENFAVEKALREGRVKRPVFDTAPSPLCSEDFV